MDKNWDNKHYIQHVIEILNEKKLIDWGAIALDGSNMRALKTAVGAKKTSR